MSVQKLIASLCYIVCVLSILNKTYLIWLDLIEMFCECDFVIVMIIVLNVYVFHSYWSLNKYKPENLAMFSPLLHEYWLILV